MMRKQENMYEFFRSREHLLEERPSREAWQRLERRLDQHRMRSRNSLRRNLLLVAAVFALALLATVVSVSVNTAETNKTSQAYQLETVSTLDGDPTAYQAITFAHQYQDRLRQPIEEGSSQQKLVVKGRDM